MQTAAIHIKTEQETKEKAQVRAKELGVSLSAAINQFLKQFIQTKTIRTSQMGEEPSEYLKSAIVQAEKDLKAGKASPIFDNGEDAVRWLEEQGI